MLLPVISRWLRVLRAQHDWHFAWLKLALMACAAFSGIGAGLACGAFVVDGEGLLLHDEVSPRVKPVKPPTVVVLEWDEGEACWHELGAEPHPERHQLEQGISDLNP